MDARSPRLGDLAAGAAGLALLVLTFLPWFEAEGAPGVEANAWESFMVVDVILLLAALFALATLVLAVSQRTPAVAIATASLTSLVGLFATVVLALRLASPPAVDIGDGGSLGAERLPAYYLALAACAALTFGAWLAMRDWRPRERVGDRPSDGERHPVEVLAAPDPNGGAPRG